MDYLGKLGVACALACILLSASPPVLPFALHLGLKIVTQLCLQVLIGLSN